MALSVWIASDTLGYPTGAGHLWAYLNWALGLRAIGCDVVWLEAVSGEPDPAGVVTLAERLASVGIERLCVSTADGEERPGLVSVEEAGSADLLLNLAYAVPPELLGRFRRSALLDLDPGMTQAWIAAGDLDLGAHDVYLTTGEGIATGTA
jgi:hypothetical protein